MRFEGVLAMRCLIIMSFLFTACAGFSPFADVETEEMKPVATTTRAVSPVPETLATAMPAPASDMELRLAKLWARVDDLENQQIRQKERMKLLEKGLMLGIIPDEL